MRRSKHCSSSTGFPSSVKRIGHHAKGGFPRKPEGPSRLPSQSMKQGDGNCIASVVFPPPGGPMSRIDLGSGGLGHVREAVSIFVFLFSECLFDERHRRMIGVIFEDDFLALVTKLFLYQRRVGFPLFWKVTEVLHHTMPMPTSWTFDIMTIVHRGDVNDYVRIGFTHTGSLFRPSSGDHSFFENIPLLSRRSRWSCGSAQTSKYWHLPYFAMHHFRFIGR